MKRLFVLLFVFVFVQHVAPQVSAQSFGGALAVGDGQLFIGETGNAAFSGEVYAFTLADEVTSEVISLQKDFEVIALVVRLCMMVINSL